MNLPRIRSLATENSWKARWHHQDSGWGFRCQLCGHRFQVGEEYIFLITTNEFGLPNPMICSSCDTPEAPRKYLELQIELYDRFWWAVDNPMGGGDVPPERLVEKYRELLVRFDAENGFHGSELKPVQEQVPQLPT